jgi:hypothetical protein
MTPLLSGCGAMPKKDDESISPYLRRRLRSYGEVHRERAERKGRLGHVKPQTAGASRGPAGETSRDEQDGR